MSGALVAISGAVVVAVEKGAQLAMAEFKVVGEVRCSWRCCRKKEASLEYIITT